MSDFNITVDTSPMADSLDVVNSNVRGVTSSVVAMESAVVIAQQKASENICHNVDTGFYILMKSQFDQKIAAVSSEMLSRMQLMKSFKDQIDKIMLTMQDDYERVKLRYTRTFNSLDKALETRIHELDKRAYEISRNYKMSQFKTGSEVIKAILYGDDTQLLNVKQVSATIKNKSLKSISVMTNDVIEQLKYSDSVKNILKEVPSQTQEMEFVPVIFSESDSMMSEDSSVKNIFTSQEASFSTDSRYLNQLKENSSKMQWKQIEQNEYEPIKNSFKEKVNQEITDERVAKEMMRLFNDSKWEQVVSAESSNDFGGSQ